MEVSMSEQTSGRRLLALVKPPKPIGEMSEQAMDQFVEELCRLIAQRLQEDDPPDT
jgi:hypothetical protein